MDRYGGWTSNWGMSVCIYLCMKILMHMFSVREGCAYMLAGGNRINVGSSYMWLIALQHSLCFYKYISSLLLIPCLKSVYHFIMSCRHAMFILMIYQDIIMANRYLGYKSPIWLHIKTKLSMYWQWANLYFLWTKPIALDHCTKPRIINRTSIILDQT